ncbi:hypothetical protein AR158_C045R [Paramecium bursaria Chlorella virus AR158]|uniref:hypothetical protein n=1 Tax=Paramecium bursaria Chlorella virus AR158 TaxID=380598 RepID=UPI00015AA74B|nr:hypothetical protein AR158_C045R [Paramecium bursaria Chlorella virus AR158]ABU43591.1 hypothetical protein AR158_C045R [Paramecium bursaria Chlorella virus AR158]
MFVASTLPVDETFPMIFTDCIPPIITFDTPTPFPTKNGAIIFPVIDTCPETSALALILITVVDTLVASTFPGADTLPDILMFRVPDRVATIPVSAAPFPMNVRAVTFPITLT